MIIKRVACVGAGLIGHSWAALFALKGFPVSLYDLSQEILEGAFEGIKSDLDFLMKEDLITRRMAEAALGRVATTTNLSEAVAEADYVQESIVEAYETKRKVFRELSAKTSEEAILASSTSGLLMTKIQDVTTKPERCVVAHPLNPPLLIPLVEIVPGERTSTETVEAVHGFMKRLGKAPVVLKEEVPGFIINRLQAAVWREAISLVDRGVASVEDVDKVLHAGLGLRWAIMGVNLTLHLGGGQGGIRYFIKHLEPTFSRIWKDMETWTSIPPSGSQKIIEGVERIPTVRGKTMNELTGWRDRKLTKLLKALYEPKAEAEKNQ